MGECGIRIYGSGIRIKFLKMFNILIFDIEDEVKNRVSLFGICYKWRGYKSLD